MEILFQDKRKKKHSEVFSRRVPRETVNLQTNLRLRVRVGLTHVKCWFHIIWEQHRTNGSAHSSNFENNHFSADEFIIWILLGRDLAAALERKRFKRDVTAVKTTLDASEITKFRGELNLE